jgi:hypothetical protein
MKGVRVSQELQTKWLGEALAAADARVQIAWTPLVQICDCTYHAQIHVALHLAHCAQAGPQHMCATFSAARPLL